MNDKKLTGKLATIGASFLIGGMLISGYLDLQYAKKVEENKLEITAENDSTKATSYDSTGKLNLDY